MKHADTSTNERPTDTPSPEAEHRTLRLSDTQIERLQASLDKINDTLKERLPEKKSQEKRAGSRGALAIGFAVLFAKIGGAFGAKYSGGVQAKEIYTILDEIKKIPKAEVVAIPEGASELQRVEAWLERLYNQTHEIGLYTRAQAAMAGFWQKMGIAGVMGALAGAVAGAGLGWWRGDRIKDPMDMVNKPIDSVKRIVGLLPADRDEPDKKQAAEEATTPASQSHSEKVAQPSTSVRAADSEHSPPAQVQQHQSR